MTTKLSVVHIKPTRSSAFLTELSPLPGSPPCQIQLDTSPWFSWLAQNKSFRLLYHSPTGGHINITIRPEKRGSHTYWQAYKTMVARSHKKYIGSTPNMTKVNLEIIGHWFFRQRQAYLKSDPAMPAHIAAIDLIWLVERLLEHCSQPDWIQYAQTDLARIKRDLGYI